MPLAEGELVTAGATVAVLDSRSGLNSDAVAASILTFGMNTEVANGVKGKGNFKVQNMDFGPQS